MTTMKALFLLTAALAVAPTTDAFVAPFRKAARSSTALADTAHNVVYSHTIRALASILQDTKQNLTELEALAKKLKSLETMDPAVAENSNDVLKQTVAEAKAAVDRFGNDSPQAEQAWKDVDAGDISHPSFRYTESAVNHHHSYDAVVDTALLEDAIQSVEKLLALDHFVEIERERLLEQAGKGGTTK